MNGNSAARRRTYWLLQALGWSLWGLTGLALVSIFGKFTWMLPPIEVIIAGTTLLGSHALRAVVRRRGWLPLSLPRLLPRLALAIAAVAAGTIVLIGLLIMGLLWLTHQLSGHFPWVQYVGYYINTCFALALWAALYLGAHYVERYRRAEVDRWKLAAAAREAELRTLQAQLNPHFLFNGLNNIRALVMEDPTRARTMMTRLAELLRYAMQRTGAEQVPLATELEIVHHYLQLEAMQLEDRLRYSVEVAPAALAVPVPPLTLQLLVENAIKHGLAPRPAGGSLSVSAWLETTGGATSLRVAVRNTGQFAPRPGHAGVGLRNVHERLALLYGPAAYFRIGPDSLQPGTVLAEISLPAADPATPLPLATTQPAPFPAPSFLSA